MLIGIDVGGTNLRLGLIEYLPVEHLLVDNSQNSVRLIEEIRFQADFSSLCKSHLYSPSQAWHNILNTIANAIQTVRKQYPTVSAVGIGFPGFIDPHTNKIAQSPNLPGLHNVDLATDLSQIIGLTVVVENDALAAAYGEFINSKMHANGSLIYVGLGTGVGGGLILNGLPVQGQHGLAMEIGHIIVAPNGRQCGCGNLGCMEQYASASGVANSYLAATNQHCSAAEIAVRANNGDQAALAAFALAGSSLAQALAHVLKVIDIGNIVIGGGMSAAWSLMQAGFEQQLTQDLIPVLRGKVNVTISNMGDQAGIVGAAMLALQKA